MLILLHLIHTYTQDFLLDPGVFDSCTLIAPLTWETYDGWRPDATRYEVWANQKSPASDWPGPSELVATLEGAVTNYDFFAKDGRQHCVQVLAINIDVPDTVRSNEICIDLPLLWVQDHVILDSVSVDQRGNKPPGTVTLSWDNDLSVTPFVRGQLFRSRNGIDFILVDGLDYLTYYFEDVEANAHSGPVTYRLHAYDGCESESVSNTVTTIYLQSEITETAQNSLAWTPYQNEFLFDNLFYSVFAEQVNTSITAQDPIAVYPADRFTHTEMVDLNEPEQRTRCYAVVSAPRLYYRGKIYDRTTSFSNSACLTHTTPLFIPNAFAPDGVNQEFKIYGHFGKVEQFSVQIFNRYGSLVFESKAPDFRWDGTSRGRDLPLGIYIYVLKMRQSDGNWIERQGDVLLAR